jgi:HK97 family phage portal protein
MWPFKKKRLEQKGFDGYNCNYSSVASWNEWDAKKAVEEGFKSSVPVFACIKKRYDAVSSIPWVVETLQGDEWIATPSHPLQRLIDNPNPEMSTGELMRLLMTHLDLAGNGYWKKVRGGMGDMPLELWPVMPYNISIRTNSDGTINYYKQTCNGDQIPADDMCQFKYTNPDDYYFGQSPLQAAGKAVDVDNAGQEWQKISMQNRAVPDYAISFDSDLTPDQYKQADEVIKAKTGTGSAREPLVLSKAKIQQLSQTPVEMDFMNTRRFSREEVSSVYGVPSALYAEMNEANLSNAETARKVFWLDTIIPLMDELKDALNHCLVQDFSDNKENIRIVYDVTNVAALQVNLNERIENATRLHSMGVPFNTLNQRMELGFDDIDGGDVGYISSSLIPTSFDFNSETEESKKLVYDAILKKNKE